MAHKVNVPQKNYVPQFLKQRDINSYYVQNCVKGGVSLAAELDKLWSEVWARGRLDIPGTKVPASFFFFLQHIFI